MKSSITYNKDQNEIKMHKESFLLNSFIITPTLVLYTISYSQWKSIPANRYYYYFILCTNE